MEAVWAGAVGLLGGDREVAAAAAADLAARYGESHRRYHGIAHARAVCGPYSGVRHWLARAGVGEAQVTRAEELVLATAAHAASPDDPAAQALLDADLAVLGADPAAYDRYRLAVREEYAALDEAAWRAGRTAVMSGLLARDPLYGTPAARRRWEAQAKANIARELDSLTGGAPPR